MAFACGLNFSIFGLGPAAGYCEHRDQLQDTVNTVINLGFYKTLETILLSLEAAS
jgi:hypothetical protein